jgi:hypothetical protein
VTGTDWRMSYEMQNLAPSPVQVNVVGNYICTVGHAPRLWLQNYHVNGVLPSGSLMDISTAWNARAFTVSAGGSGVNLGIAGGASVAGIVEQHYDYTWVTGGGIVDVQPVTNWMRQRNGVHRLYLSAQGDYAWAWTTPYGWQGSHSPIAYTVTPECRVTFSIEYYVP